MITITSIKDDIKQQIRIGFSSQEIETNLQARGFTETEIKTALVEINMVKEPESGVIGNKSILLGIFFIVVALAKFGSFTNGGNVFVGIGIILAIVMAIFHFTNKR